MNKGTFKSFQSTSPDTDQPLPSQHSLELEPVATSHNTGASSSPTIEDTSQSTEVPIFNREQSSEHSSPKRFKKCTSSDETDSDEHTATPSPLHPAGTLPHIPPQPPNTLPLRSVSQHPGNRIPRRREERGSNNTRGQNRARPTNLFPRGTPETHEGGHPAELVTPENRPVRCNNGTLHIVGLVAFITPVRDNNNQLLNNSRHTSNPRDYRRTQSY